MERFIPKGAEQQNITPELGLSMELRDTCERLLQEKGKNEICVNELLFQIFQPIGIIRVLVTGYMPQNIVRRKVVRLEKDKSSESNVVISCPGMHPSKAREVGVYISSMQDHLPLGVGKTFLFLKKHQRGEILDIFLDSFLAASMLPDRERFATMEELEAYQRYIKQSSPIEHK